MYVKKWSVYVLVYYTQTVILLIIFCDYEISSALLKDDQN